MFFKHVVCVFVFLISFGVSLSAQLEFESLVTDEGSINFLLPDDIVLDYFFHSSPAVEDSIVMFRHPRAANRESMNIGDDTLFEFGVLESVDVPHVFIKLPILDTFDILAIHDLSCDCSMSHQLISDLKIEKLVIDNEYWIKIPREMYGKRIGLRLMALQVVSFPLDVLVQIDTHQMSMPNGYGPTGQDPLSI